MMKTTQDQIVDKMTALICPPEGIPTTGGKQLAEGNQYPNEPEIDLSKHVRGDDTYAIDVAYKDDSGTELCKWGVVDIDENGEEGLEKASAVKEHLATEGINSLIAFSGRKGFHVYVFSEPVPKEVMVKALKNIKAALDFKGEIIPGEASRCKPAPCLHQVSGYMSYLCPDRPYPEQQFGRDNLPENFYEEQLEIYNRFEPTMSNIVVKMAMADPKLQAKLDIKDMIPDMSADDGYVPPCISRLIEKGGSAGLGTYDKNNLSLAGFCASKRLSSAKGLELAKTMAKNSENGSVETTKDNAAKIRHFKSIQKTPSVKEAVFNCTYLLKAKKELGFDCHQCKVRPKGVNTSVFQAAQTQSSQLILEESIARDLMAHIIQKGRPVEPISPEVMPWMDYTSHFFKDRCTAAVFGVLLHAINDGRTSTVGVAQWIDGNIRDLKDLDKIVRVEKKSIYECINPITTPAFITEIKNSILKIWGRLSEKQAVNEDIFEEMLARAVDLTIRLKISQSANLLSQESCDKSKDIYTLQSEYTHQTSQILAGSQKGAVIPLFEKQEVLLEYLLGAGSGKTTTPFPELNELLGGGLSNHCLYMLVSPPGGGKSTFAAQIADHAASAGIPVIFVSMEMSMEQLFVNSMARAGLINSAKIMSPFVNVKNAVLDKVGEMAETYFETAAKNLYIVEGSYETTPARIESMISLVRVKHGLSKQDPVLVVIDYLQLLNTGKEFMDTSPNETLKISELAVRSKQLARDNSVAVLAISDITKDEQQKNYASKEFTLNSLRGSNRLAHAADTVIALYSESSETDGGKAKQDPWDIYAEKVGASEAAQDFLESISKVKKDTLTGGDGATAYARLELIKNRAGQGKGSQFLLYHRAYHRFEPVTLPGQAKAEGRA